MEQLNPWVVVADICRPHRKAIVKAACFMLSATLFELLPVFFLYQVFLILSGAELGYPIWSLALALLGVMVFKVVLTMCAYYQSHQAAFKAMTELRMTLLAAITAMPLTWLMQQHPAALKKNVLQDVEQLENFIAHHLVELCSAFAMPVFTFIALTLLDWRFALLTVAVVPFAFVASYIFMRNTERGYNRFSIAEKDLATTVSDYINNIAVMKVFKLDAQRFQILNQKLGRYYTIVDELTTQTVPGWVLYVGLLSATLLWVLPAGVWLYQLGEIAALEVVICLLLSTSMLRPIIKMSRFFMDANELLSGVKRISHLLESNNQQGEFDVISVNKNNELLQFIDVDYSYDGETKTLHNVTFSIEPNSFNLIIGPSGQGKSTIAMLATGLLSPTHGEVILAGMSAQKLSDQQRAQLLALVSQDIYLFEGTLKENLSLGCKQLEDQALTQALKASQLSQWVERQAAGLQTSINEGGKGLSGGEKQRIALVRALLTESPLIVLDEATSALDNLNHERILIDLQTYYPQRTFLMISHKYAGLENADQIFVVQEGALIASGSHQELLETNKYYRSNWYLQNHKQTLESVS
ncbi:ABC transporter ATP-binding protein [Pseudoalteromonas tunicata]|uniref:ABC transporter ATP-binding protein n=1 Tax=Pseudoalteromonas tunicata TaxID=314281 RepID=UPI00273D07C7|nr:ABC transporter ATP-binding protein [Pseudoalteromonas tunicata]MDP5215401.1 ABC transporter ATP-binding protein [Pseudoalteromonas tunicata]